MNHSRWQTDRERWAARSTLYRLRAGRAAVRALLADERHDAAWSTRWRAAFMAFATMSETAERVAQSLAVTERAPPR